jgi:hypothetical protein
MRDGDLVVSARVCLRRVIRRPDYDGMGYSTFRSSGACKRWMDGWVFVFWIGLAWFGLKREGGGTVF